LSAPTLNKVIAPHLAWRTCGEARLATGACKTCSSPPWRSAARSSRGASLRPPTDEIAWRVPWPQMSVISIYPPSRQTHPLAA